MMVSSCPVFASTRALELDGLGWPGPLAQGFARTQYEAQCRHYQSAYPGADHYVVRVGQHSAGRLVVERTEARILIIDIALLPQFRGGGVGAEVVGRLVDEAEEAGVSLRCHVLASNDGGRRFWDRLGFVSLGMDGAHICLERACGISAL